MQGLVQGLVQDLVLVQRAEVAPWARLEVLVFVPDLFPPCTVQGASSEDPRVLLC